MMGDVLWTPAPDARDRTRIGGYLSWLERTRNLVFDDYQSAWAWSVDDVGDFWASLWEYFGISSGYEAVLEGDLPAARWFRGASLSYAERLLATTGDGVAVIGRSQTRPPVDLTWDELRDQVGRCAAGMRRLGVTSGDRVVAYLPNIPEAVVAFLAAASIGAVWSSCPPEFGPRSVIDRFGQLEPTVLLVVAGYQYGQRTIDRTGDVAAICDELPTVRAVIEVAHPDPAIPGALPWMELLALPAPLAFERVPFDHPLYVLFSSGTTGLPKAIVHGHGGILLEHLKALTLHGDLGPEDRFFWFSTTGWMMWNLLVSGLATRASIVLFDGDPGHPDLGTLWELAAETDITVFGVSAPFLLACRKTGTNLPPLPCLRSVGSTGAPLPAEGYRWVYEQLPDVWLTSISGGTDVCTAVIGGVPLLPVVAGRMACRYLGAAVEVREGELVITRPMPSMPVYFWGDTDGSRYRAAYFERFAGLWAHGDWISIAEDGSCVITGRSDATLNRGGIRLGTSEFYRVIEAMPEVTESLVVHLEDDGAGRLLLFVQLQPIVTLHDDLRRAIATRLRTELSPRHVPDEIIAVPGIPRTHSGKKLEVPVKRILTGTPAAEVVSLGALANPDVLATYEAYARTHGDWAPQPRAGTPL